MAQKTPRNHVVKVNRSNKNFLLQVINKSTSKTLFAVQTSTKDKGTKTEKVQKAAETVAKKLKDQKISEVLFDRSNLLYHGRVQAAAESLRANGITI